MIIVNILFACLLLVVIRWLTLYLFYSITILVVELLTWWDLFKNKNDKGNI